MDVQFHVSIADIVESELVSRLLSGYMYYSSNDYCCTAAQNESSMFSLYPML